MIKFLDYLADKLSDVILLFDDTTDEFARGAVGRINLINEENHVTKEQYDKRIKTCMKCDDCKNDVCRLCGCPVHMKAKLKESKGGECPNDLWEKLNN